MPGFNTFNPILLSSTTILWNWQTYKRCDSDTLLYHEHFIFLASLQEGYKTIVDNQVQHSLQRIWKLGVFVFTGLASFQICTVQWTASNPATLGTTSQISVNIGLSNIFLTFVSTLLQTKARESLCEASNNSMAWKVWEECPVTTRAQRDEALSTGMSEISLGIVTLWP